jgi:hypothetical protein
MNPLSFTTANSLHICARLNDVAMIPHPARRSADDVSNDLILNLGIRRWVGEEAA